MANGINLVTVGGNLGADPELKVTQSGTSVLALSLACNQSYLDKNRVRQETTEWIKVTVWGRRAEGLAKFLRKGSWILVEGSLRTSNWEDREGIKRYKTEVVAKNVLLGGSPSARGNASRSRSQERDPEHRRPNRRDNDAGESHDTGAPGGGGYDDQDYGSPGDDDGDIPFCFATGGSREPWWRF